MSSELKRIVAKFGGTSMQDEVAMRRSAQVAIDQKASIIVVSACAGVTNQLLELSKECKSHDPKEGGWSEESQAAKILREIIQRHKTLAQKLEASQVARNNLESLFTELTTLSHGIFLLGDCSKKTEDSLVSLGERMSSLLFTECLGAMSSRPVDLLDVREVIITDEKHGQANPDFWEIEKRCQKIDKDILEKTLVTQGFMGSSHKGATTTLGRGGSDYSAALLAWGIEADVLQIWTDVPGMATTDPRITSKAKIIPEITYQEAAELAIFGAKILHPTTLAPAVQKNIPVFVGSSFDPPRNDEEEQKGTWIRSTIQSEKNIPLVRALAMRKDQHLLTLTTPKMLQAHGFLYQIFCQFNRFQVSVDAITTSEISVAMTLQENDINNQELIEALEEMAQVSIERDLELVSLIGNRINHTPGIGAKIFQVLGDINVRMVCLGASKHNFCFLVEKGRGKEAIARLHQAFLEDAP